ncbi:MAG: toprim domain-containing protein [Methanofastidiosum sp.]
MTKNEEFAQILGLRKVKIRGDEIHASCPFSERHFSGRDNHPSFSINIDKGVFNCFSCGARGTIEELVSQLKRVTISEALSMLEGFGFSKLDRELRKQEEYERPEILPEGLLLYYDKVEDAFAETYRGIVDDQECLIYPVRNISGKLVGALARSVDGKFHKVMWNMQKKLYLYGEDKHESERPLVIVEGPGDVIALRKSGVSNVVGLMGVNISDEQVEKLLLMTSHFIVWLDKDRAGAKGMNIAHRKLENRGLVKYVDPWKAGIDGKDPKDCYENQGKEKVQEIIMNAKTFFEHVLEDRCRV